MASDPDTLLLVPSKIIRIFDEYLLAPSQIFLSISLSPTDLWFELIHFPEKQIEPINSNFFDYYVSLSFALKTSVLKILLD